MRDRWTIETELLAQLIEITSIPAAERKLKEPVKIPRPDDLAKKRRRATAQPTVEGTQQAFAILAASSRSKS